MTNPLAIQQAPQLPAHLSKFANLGFALNESVIGGLSSGGGHPSIGIKQSRWRIREGANEEVVQAFTLNVIIVNANKHLSKVFYADKYNPNDEGKAPDCFSDNGIAPSVQATKPQCETCAMCPNNVWGSKISELGSKIKACADYKKLAVVLADDPDRDVYELRVPGASLKELNAIMSKLITNKVPIPAVVFELSFDSTAQFPKIVFKPIGYVDEAQAQSVEAWVNSNEAKEAVGQNDVPISGPVPTAVAAPQPVAQIPAPAPQAPAQEDPMAFMHAAPAATPAKGRGRPRKDAAPVQMSLDIPGVQAPAQATPINPAKTDADLDALLAGIL